MRLYRLLLPQRNGYMLTQLAYYIAYGWVDVWVQRKINLDDELPATPPPDLEQSSQTTFSLAKHGEKTDQGVYCTSYTMTS